MTIPIRPADRRDPGGGQQVPPDLRYDVLYHPSYEWWLRLEGGRDKPLPYSSYPVVTRSGRSPGAGEPEGGHPVTVTRCDCCDLPSSMCGKAAETRQRAERRRERAALLARPDWMAAQYAGSCNTCGERFEPGTPITLDRRSLTWKAECCS